MCGCYRDYTTSRPPKAWEKRVMDELLDLNYDLSDSAFVVTYTDQLGCPYRLVRQMERRVYPTGERALLRGTPYPLFSVKAMFMPEAGRLSVKELINIIPLAYGFDSVDQAEFAAESLFRVTSFDPVIDIQEDRNIGYKYLLRSYAAPKPCHSCKGTGLGRFPCSSCSFCLADAAKSISAQLISRFFPE